MSDDPPKKRDWQGTFLFVLALAGSYAGVVTTWAVQGERIDVLGVHRQDHETRLRSIESNSAIASAVNELKIEIKALTVKNEALEKQVAALVAQRRGR